MWAAELWRHKCPSCCDSCCLPGWATCHIMPAGCQPHEPTTTQPTWHPVQLWDCFPSSKGSLVCSHPYLLLKAICTLMHFSTWYPHVWCNITVVPSLLLATDNATLSTWRSLCPSGASFMPDHMLTVIGAQSQSLCFNMDLAFCCIPVYKDDCVTIVRVIVNSSVFCPDLAHYYITVLLLLTIFKNY